jgi:hypothetical protein
MESNINSTLSEFINRKVNRDNTIKKGAQSESEAAFSETLASITEKTQATYDGLTNSLLNSSDIATDPLETPYIPQDTDVEDSNSTDSFQNLFNSVSDDFQTIAQNNGGLDARLEEILNKIQQNQDTFVPLPADLEAELDELIHPNKPLNPEVVKNKAKLFYSYAAIQIDLVASYKSNETGETTTVRASASIFALTYTATQHNSTESVDYLAKLLEKLKEKPDHPLYGQIYDILDKIRRGEDVEFIKGDNNTQLNISEIAADALDLFKDIIEQFFKQLPEPIQTNATTESTEQTTDDATVSETDDTPNNRIANQETETSGDTADTNTTPTSKNPVTVDNA